MHASEAHIIAQLQQSKIKFDREQRLLNNILDLAKNGSFEAKYFDKIYYNLANYVGFAINETDLKFLKDLGYVIETTERMYKMYSHLFTNSDGIIHKPEIKLYPYNEYIVKW